MNIFRYHISGQKLHFPENSENWENLEKLFFKSFPATPQQFSQKYSGRKWKLSGNFCSKNRTLVHNGLIKYFEF